LKFSAGNSAVAPFALGSPASIIVHRRLLAAWRVVVGVESAEGKLPPATPQILSEALPTLLQPYGNGLSTFLERLPLFAKSANDGSSLR